MLESGGYVGWTGKNTFSNVQNNSGCSDYLHKRVVDAVPYLGFGLGAQSYSHHTLTYNLGGVTKALPQYLKSVELDRLPTQDVYHLSRSEATQTSPRSRSRTLLRSNSMHRSGAMGKMASVSFYFGGIDNGAFRNAFGVDLVDVFPKQIDFCLARGLMRCGVITV
jgi:oxygen-independent coproporphyrinogen-3 oxidase